MHYGEFGHAMWEDQEFLSGGLDEVHRDELQGLHELLQNWLIRDIRFHVFERQLTDAKPLTGPRLEWVAALTHR